MSTPVREAIDAYLAVWTERGADWGYWMEQVGLARAEFARMIHARPEDIAVMGSVSDAASSIASALDFEGDRRQVVTTTLDFPSLCHVWLAQAPRGARVRFVQVDAGRTDSTARLLSAMDDDTRLVSVSQVCFYDGQRIDAAVTGRQARRCGAIQFVDAYQSAGQIAIDAGRDGLDILAAGAQKYLLGVPGIAFMYVRPALAETLTPTVTGWFGRVDPFAFAPAGLDFPPNAQRFNTGTPPMICASAALAGLRLLNEIGVGEIEAYLQQLSAAALEEARRLKLEVASPPHPAAKGSTTAIRVPDAAALEARMLAAGYVVSARNDVIRVAPHFYNQVDEVIGALREIARQTR